MLELWQTEWCPASRRVRERLTELGVDYVARQVPVEKNERAALVTATGTDTIPALVARDGAAIVGEDAIRVYFDKTTLFPRRILYTKQIPGRKVSRPMLTLDFTNVKLNGPVSDQDFTFVPPATPVANDITQAYVGRLIGAGGGMPPGVAPPGAAPPGAAPPGSAPNVAPPALPPPAGK